MTFRPFSPFSCKIKVTSNVTSRTAHPTYTAWYVQYLELLPSTNLPPRWQHLQSPSRHVPPFFASVLGQEELFMRYAKSSHLSTTLVFNMVPSRDSYVEQIQTHKNYICYPVYSSPSITLFTTNPDNNAVFCVLLNNLFVILHSCDLCL